MKLKLLIMSALFVVGTATAQFTVKDDNDNPIVDGQVVEFAQAGFPDGELKFFVTNTGSNPIKTKIQFVSAVNADGSEMELCYGLCYTGITIGNSYPPGTDFIEILPGETTPQGNHFLNNATDTSIIDYVFKFYEIDNSGNQIGNPLTMTYRYNPNLGVDDVSNLGVVVNSTIIKGSLDVSTTENMKMTVYNLLGKEVFMQNLTVGNNQIDFSNLSSQLYIVKFNNEKGSSKVFKIIVK